MVRTTHLGGGLFVIGLIGYITGIYVAYPGRAFSVTAIMIGIALVAIAHQSSTEDTA